MDHAAFRRGKGMNPKRVLAKETVVLSLQSTTKEDVIGELVDVLVAAGRLTDRAPALKAVLERERKMSTGLQNGIAIPHGKTDSVETLIAAIGVKKEGIPFDSLDGAPAQIFLLTLSPATRTGPHIQFLAEISRTLHDPATRQKVIEAQSADELIDLVCGDHTAEAAKAGQPQLT
jgi:fructose-specific phosphotransferase system IIA component